MAKRVWVTWMATGEGAPGPEEACRAISGVGLDTSGSPWVDDLEKHAWAELAQQIALGDERPDLWVVAARREDLQDPGRRFALSLCAAMARGMRGEPLSCALVGLDFEPKQEELPTLLRSWKLIEAKARWHAKLAILANKKPKPSAEPYRVSAMAMPYMGQWLEVGPREGSWEGAMLGVTGEGKIENHAVGKRSELPEKTTLNYPLEGIECEVGGDDYTAFAVQNPLAAEDAYFVKISGTPHKLLFGTHPGSEQNDVWVVSLV